MGAPYKTRKGVLSSGGAGDAGKVPLLNALGYLDGSFLQIKDVQVGTATGTATGTHTCYITVTFGRDFDEVPMVFPVLRQAQICEAGVPGTIAVTGRSKSGFIAKIDVNVDDTNSIWNININPVIDWFAVLIA